MEMRIINLAIHPDYLEDGQSNSKFLRGTDIAFAVVEIPFEKFVLNPDSYIKRISDSIDVMPDHITKKEMRKQGFPRRSTTDAPYNSVYARYGWEKPKRHLSFLDEVDETRNKLKKVLPAKAMLLLESITSNYINRYNF